MDMLKRVLAVLGAAFGSLALSYFVFAWLLTFKDFGLGVEPQLIQLRGFPISTLLGRKERKATSRENDIIHA